jgi:protein-tyrosine phosphatase
VFSWFKTNKHTPAKNSLFADIHSHLVPAIDDGVQTPEESLRIIKKFSELGYTKLITTPHVMSDTYKNTSSGILDGLARLNTFLKENQIDVTVEAAAEYYLDEHLMSMLKNQEPLLTFGKKYLLFETNFLNEPFNLKDFIFLATTQGYKPVLAHPERYMYLQTAMDKSEDLINRGVLFQINISSITGYYSRVVQTAAHKLIDKGWVHFLGSDCHHDKHIEQVEIARKMKYFQKALTLPLLNNSL